MNKPISALLLITIVGIVSTYGSQWPSTGQLNTAFDADWSTTKSGRHLVDRYNLDPHAQKYVVVVGDPSNPQEMVVQTQYQEWVGMVDNSTRAGDAVLNTTRIPGVPYVTVPLRSSAIIRWNVTVSVAGLQERRLATAKADFDIIKLLRVVSWTNTSDYLTYAKNGRVTSLVYGPPVSNSTSHGSVPDAWWKKAEDDPSSFWSLLQLETSSFYSRNVQTRWTQVSRLFNNV